MPGQNVRYEYIDHIDAMEAFADSVRSVTLIGTTVRIELLVMRVSAQKSESAIAEKHTAARLVITAPAAADLYNRLKVIMEQLEQSGALKKMTGADSEPVTVQ